MQQVTNCSNGSIYLVCGSRYGPKYVLQYIDMLSNSLHGEIPILADCPARPDVPRVVVQHPHRRHPSLAVQLDETSVAAAGLKLPQGRAAIYMFGGMRSLELLHLMFNFLSSPQNNTVFEPFFASLMNYTGLNKLDVARNGLTSRIPIGERHMLCKTFFYCVQSNQDHYRGPGNEIISSTIR